MTTPTLQHLPDVVMHCILMNLGVHDRVNIAEVSSRCTALLEEKLFWSSLRLDCAPAFVNKVCRYVFAHGSRIEQLFIDNVSSSEASFLVSWMDVIMSALPNVCKLVVERSIFLTNGLFVTTMPKVEELRLESCPNLCVFSLIQGFACAEPQCLTELSLTGVPGLDETSVVRIATSCCNLKTLDISGGWGPFLTVKSVRATIAGCNKLNWLDFCAYKPTAPLWLMLVNDVAHVHFGPFVSHVLGIEKVSG